MTLTRFVTKNAFRNKRRSILTVLSIGGSLLLLTFLITIWRSFYDSKPSEQSAQRLIVRHKVSLVFNLPSYYRDKIRALPHVKEVVNQQWFGGQYKDDKPNNFFAQFGTDPDECQEQQLSEALALPLRPGKNRRWRNRGVREQASQSANRMQKLHPAADARLSPAPVPPRKRQ